MPFNTARSEGNVISQECLFPYATVLGRVDDSAKATPDNSWQFMIEEELMDTRMSHKGTYSIIIELFIIPRCPLLELNFKHSPIIQKSKNYTSWLLRKLLRDHREVLVKGTLYLSVTRVKPTMVILHQISWNLTGL